MSADIIQKMILLAGHGQLVLVVSSVFIPLCLGWKEPLASLPKLMRQLFWTYGAYLLGMHLFFGLVSTFSSGRLIDGTPQAVLLSGLMMVWWGVRIVLQFFCFDRSGIPKTRFNTAAEAMLVCLFIYLATTYGLAFSTNFQT